MRKMQVWVMLVLFVAMGTIVSAGSSTPSEEKNIVETAIAAGSFGTLVTAVKAAGLV